MRLQRSLFMGSIAVITLDSIELKFDSGSMVFSPASE